MLAPVCVSAIVTDGALAGVKVPGGGLSVGVARVGGGGGFDPPVPPPLLQPTNKIERVRMIRAAGKRATGGWTLDTGTPLVGANRLVLNDQSTESIDLCSM